MDILSGIELAVKNETDGVRFYRKARNQTDHPFGKVITGIGFSGKSEDYWMEVNPQLPWHKARG